MKTQPSYPAVLEWIKSSPTGRTWPEVKAYAGREPMTVLLALDAKIYTLSEKHSLRMVAITEGDDEYLPTLPQTEAR